MDSYNQCGGSPYACQKLEPPIVSLREIGDYKTTRLLVYRVLDGKGLAHIDSRDFDWFGLETPYVQYVGCFSHSIARA